MKKNQEFEVLVTVEINDICDVDETYFIKAKSKNEAEEKALAKFLKSMTVKINGRKLENSIDVQTLDVC